MRRDKNMQQRILTPGDRMPNFALRNSADIVKAFYMELGGGPIILLAFRSAEDPDQSAILSALVAETNSLRAAGKEIFAISNNDVATNAATVERYGLDFPLYADPEEVILPATAESTTLAITRHPARPPRLYDLCARPQSKDPLNFPPTNDGGSSA